MRLRYWPREVSALACDSDDSARRTEVLRLVELPEPEITGERHVKVRLRAAGINPADYKQRAGGTIGGSLPVEAAGRALERGLDLAEPAGLLLPFLLYPVPELLERHARVRTAHPALIRKIITALGGRTPAAPAAGQPEQAAPAAGQPQRLPEPLSHAEARVLRLLQTSLPRRKSPASSTCR
jgi:hypothetical protein